MIDIPPPKVVLPQFLLACGPPPFLDCLLTAVFGFEEEERLPNDTLLLSFVPSMGVGIFMLYGIGFTRVSLVGVFLVYCFD